MKIVHNGASIIGTATDDYIGPDQWAPAPEDFDATRMSEYTIQEGLVVLVPSTRITKLAFRNRFLQAEKIGIDLASIDDPSGTMPQRQQQAALRVYLADVASASWIDLARADTRAGVQQLEALGVLGAGRALVILDTPVALHERPL